MKKVIDVAQYVAQFLVDKQVRHIFGYPGRANLKLIDEMVRTGKISYIQNYHEQASAFCADGYSRVTNNIGVAISTSGPGATNMLTGIANAYFDSIPTIFLTGQDNLGHVTRGNGARQNGFQDVDIVSMAKPITKYATIVKEPNRIRYEMEKAYYLATTGRPGAVLLDIPIDIQFAKITPILLEEFTETKFPLLAFSTQEVKDAILLAKRPIILIGGGVRAAKACNEVRIFANLTNIPVVTTLTGLDVLENNYGFAGLNGKTAANLAVNNADLLLAFGTKFGLQHVGKVPEKYTKAKIIHVDVDPAELGRFFPNENSFHVDLKYFLKVLNLEINSLKFPDYTSWHKKIRLWSDNYSINDYLNITPDGVDPVKAIERMSDFIQEDAILCNDVGQNQLWVSQAFKLKGRQRLLNSCGHGSMGFSIPAAIAAKIAFPKKQVFAFAGDGGFQMNIQELMLISHRALGIKCVIFNNNTLGMIREIQVKYYDNRCHGTNPQEFSCVNLEQLSKTYDLKYRYIKSLKDIIKLKDELQDDDPYIIEIPLSIDSKLSNRFEQIECFDLERILE